jgi:uncharacterized protein (TIGR02266 family)
MNALPDLSDDLVTDPTDRRFTPRARLEAEVSLASDTQFFTGLTRNLSTGGVFVATYQPLPIGSHVVLTLTMPDGDLVARGTVRWLRDASTGAPPGMGIAFESLYADEFQRIEAFCQVREPLLHDD